MLCLQQAYSQTERTLTKSEIGQHQKILLRLGHSWDSVLITEDLYISLQRYHSLCMPLRKKGKPYSWTNVEQKAFDTLRHALTHTPILAYPDFSREFLLFTDASNISIGCVLSQLNATNREHVIAYGSHTLTATERRWSTFDRELWAIVWSIRHFRQYLTGHSF